MPLSPGQILNNRYRIVKLLGQGGFGAVYHAWDAAFELPCAVKENSETTPEAQRQFLREAKTLHTLRHPNLPLVKDYFLVEGQGQYLVMDFIEGQDLQEMLAKRGRSLSEEQVLPWILQVCKALEYLHTQQPPVIHRDLKPANIKITPEGKAVLVDFGLSKVFDPNLPTNSGAHGRGTPGYSPPEQYGQGSTDPRSDIYALGATLYHCLTGAIPPDSVDVLTGVTPPPTPAHRLNMTVTVRTGAAVERAMQMHKEGRWGSVRELRVALTPIATPSPTPFMWRGSPEPAREAGELVKGGTVVLPTPPAWVPTQVIAEPPAAVSSKASVAQPIPKTAGLSLRVLLGGGALGLAVFVVAIFLILRLINPPRVTTHFTSTNSTVAAVTTAELTSNASRDLLTQTMAAELIGGFKEGVTQTAVINQIQMTQAAATQIGLALESRTEVPMILIPAGEFQMGSETGNSDELPVHKVYLDAYSIDVYEVTNARYAECVDAGTCDPPHDPIYFNDPSYVQHPVVNLDWDQAQSYCTWRDGDLPTEAQWEKAARGGLEGKIYPWGDEAPVCTKSIVNGAQFGKCGSTVIVGSFSHNGYGLNDMAGNVWEWVRDWYLETFYNHSPSENPTGPDSGQFRALRGGSWYFLENDLRVANRLRRDPTQGYNIVGFRCAGLP